MEGSHFASSESLVQDSATLTSAQNSGCILAKDYSFHPSIVSNTLLDDITYINYF